MNRMTEFTFSLADSLLKLFFTIFPISTTSEEIGHSKEEAASEETHQPKEEAATEEMAQLEEETVSEETAHPQEETASRSLVKQNTFTEEYRTTELVTGLIGSIMGVLTIILARVMGSIGAILKFNGTGFGEVMNVATPIFAVVAITGVILQGKYPKLGGWLIIIAAVEGFVAMPFLYLPSGSLLLIAGYMGIQRGNQIRSGSH